MTRRVTNSQACCLPVAVLVPVLAWDRATLVGIGLDQAGINRKAITANQPRRDAIGYDPLKQLAQKIAGPESALSLRARG